ncbi:MAG: hypothetical protein N2517_09330, partial [Ignavibacteria bacterium]|nr:hypothetical protein [Ignavibacteria bacterium]
ALIAIILGYFLYKLQKNIDFKESKKGEYITLLNKLINKIFFADSIIERGINTLKLAKNNEQLSEIVDILTKSELPRLSVVLNEEIPMLIRDISFIHKNYFSKKKILNKAYNDFNNQIVQWLNFYIASYSDWLTTFLTEKAKHPQIDIKLIENIINELIVLIQKKG